MDLASGPAAHEVSIELSAQASAALRKNPRGYVRASLRVDGETFRDVGLHLKGATGSFRPLDDKPSLTLDLDRFTRGQQFCGVVKFHLNNSAEDPSYLHELLGGELFRAAGIPVPQVSHALVTLNGRRLGLYVFKEGFAEEFLRRSFPSTDGILYEPEAGQDINGRMQTRVGENTPEARSLRHTLAEAAREPDLGRRWQRLGEVLDLERFLSFMAVEVIVGHRDGYALAKNNFRLHLDPATGKATFLPHGMDQLFAQADLPWEPHLAGLVARAVMEAPEGRRRYEARFRALSTELLQVEALTNRVNEAVARLRPFVTRAEAKVLRREAAGLCARIAQRATSLQRQLDRAPRTLLEFSQGVAALSGWEPTDAPDGGKLDQASGPGSKPVLHLTASPVTSAFWRTTVLLSPGRYRFEGRARTAGVAPLPFGQNQGAALRVAGDRPRSPELTGDSAWQALAVEFAVGADREELGLRCELRASAGEAWFDLAALRLVKLD